MLRPLVLAAAGLSAANAFLLVPELVPEVRTSHGHSNLEAHGKDGQSHTLLLECPGPCPVPMMGDGGKIHLAEGINNHFELNFRIDNSGKLSRLVVNDFELFPHPDPMHHALIAKQIPEAGEDGAAPPPVEAAVPVQLGASLAWHRMSPRKHKQALLVVELQIVQILSGFRSGIPNVRVALMQCAKTGALQIADISPIKSQYHTRLPLAKQLADCGDNTFCKVRAVMLDKLRKVTHKLGHGGHRVHCGNHHAHGHHQGGHPHGHHNGHGMNGSPHFKHREHSWGQLLNKLVHHILFPIGVGIVAGVFVSIVGMAVGTLLVGLWRVFVRGQPFFHRRRHSHRRSSRAAALVADEKAGLMANVEEPPVYKDEEAKENN